MTSLPEVVFANQHVLRAGFEHSIRIAQPARIQFAKENGMDRRADDFTQRMDPCIRGLRMAFMLPRLTIPSGCMQQPVVLSRILSNASIRSRRST